MENSARVWRCAANNPREFAIAACICPLTKMPAATCPSFTARSHAFRTACARSSGVSSAVARMYLHALILCPPAWAADAVPWAGSRPATTKIHRRPKRILIQLVCAGREPSFHPEQSERKSSSHAPRHFGEFRCSQNASAHPASRPGDFRFFCSAAFPRRITVCAILRNCFSEHSAAFSTLAFSPSRSFPSERLSHIYVAKSRRRSPMPRAHLCIGCPLPQFGVPQSVQ